MLINIEKDGRQNSGDLAIRNDSSSCLLAIMESLEKSKAEDICLVENTSVRSLLCDNMIIVSGRSGRHVVSIADNLIVDLKQKNIKVFGVEGLVAANWVLVDAGDVIVHVFHPESRKLYNLEEVLSSDKTREESH
ncbi:ribosome silencing factor [Candidatus Liberibacter sp.]|uniref:ribosome silencing factor n=1 Tax=Candidatus Liberibacter sp. TaxID=34022 RepID=UPI0015F671E4|nr:ribosome silencing factor [Candidatus Liberibacter sp.]MBA5723564.1 ribosome silencing factor [Candidatus Liberibacter sp.]